MRYRLRRCSCRACAEESTYLKCPWRAKTLHCKNADLVDILETGTHVTEMLSVPKHRLTSEMKVFAQEMTAPGLKPVRIRNAILRSARAFHLLALFLPSQRKEEHYTEMFAALNRIYRQVIGKPLVVEKVMGDADAAQLNGVTQGFGGSAQLKYLMCFYHVVAKVVERTRVLQPPHDKSAGAGGVGICARAGHLHYILQVAVAHRALH
ncbi:hypothetical protein PC129_g9487 [Phytophthora cactorum]|uniref:MULE transposase domain-containing protein n=1 Tax=Phytophthora cactorum TaxID=29920 RepID=A0A8T1I592_9STRA|nr:hypothetical protein PC129_g9487 [Phytophthora cactorum]